MDRQPGKEHVPFPPCFVHTPRATAVVSQSSTLQTFRAECFLHRDLPIDDVVHPATPHTPYAPCATHFSRALAAIVQPVSLHIPCAPCLVHSFRAIAGVLQPCIRHTPIAPCLANSPRRFTAGVLQSSIAQIVDAWCNAHTLLKTWLSTSVDSGSTYGCLQFGIEHIPFTLAACPAFILVCAAAGPLPVCGFALIGCSSIRFCCGRAAFTCPVDLATAAS